MNVAPFFEDLTRRIASGVTFDELFQSLFTELRRAIPCDRLALAFVHDETRSIIVGPVRGGRRILLGTGFREPLAGSELHKFSPRPRNRVVADLRTLSGTVAQMLVREGLRSSLSVPLIVDGAVVGALWFCSRKRNAYRPEHDAFTRAVAGQLALLLEKARLLGKIAVDASLKSHLTEENTRLRELAAPAMPELIGSSPPWRKLLKRIELVAATDATVLIRGETGTGKELVARAIHRLSPRKQKPFVAVNCGALAPELLASELFGHEKGAFTGAIARRLGRIELAQGGTLFLDEIAELAPDMQVKLLRVLQEREFERVGGAQVIRTDARVIAATHRNLERERTEGRFRDDLFFRVNVFPIQVPPLRERKEDLQPLLEFFLERYARKFNKRFTGIAPQSHEQCLYYHWPGNVRELENLVERSVILSPGGLLSIDPLLEPSLAAPDDPSASLELNAIIRAHLIKVLRITRGKIYGANGAAALLKMKPSTLQAKMKKLGVERLEN